ncbi:MAG TPA: response regulator, partial [Nitrospira sp.]|nr:response regulator [Nitrospira sp.]
PTPAPSRDVVHEVERNPDQTVKAVSITGSRGAQADVLFSRVVREFSDRIVEAGKARGMDAIDQAQTERYASLLIDVPDQKRVLWVDDRPNNNRMETAALNKLQIEVVPVIGTKEALGRLESDPEPFDLVLSDWVRPELHLDTLSAGIHLLRQLRKRQLPVPVVFYHSTSSEQERDQRREQALREGAFGEAVMPDELLGLVTKALALQ